MEEPRGVLMLGSYLLGTTAAFGSQGKAPSSDQGPSSILHCQGRTDLAATGAGGQGGAPKREDGSIWSRSPRGRSQEGRTWYGGWEYLEQKQESKGAPS